MVGLVTIAGMVFGPRLTRRVPGVIVGLAGGMLCYGVSLIVWIMGLSRVPVSIAYPLLSLGYVINAVMAHYLLGESVNLQRMVGISFIILGVFIVARSGN